ncbi:MAG: hypothetical protein SFU98_07345 [Leptospiraceae bacterium]|nr:hypothetical protein [Leptospiraceae bacterium]
MSDRRESKIIRQDIENLLSVVDSNTENLSPRLRNDMSIIIQDIKNLLEKIDETKKDLSSRIEVLEDKSSKSKGEEND